MKPVLLAVIWALLGAPAMAWVPQEKPGLQNERPDAIEDVGIDEKLNESLALQVPLKNEAGENVTLSQFAGTDRPVILSMVYFSCPSLCNLHLNGVFEVFEKLNLKPGKDFEFVAVSIDGGETPDLAQSKKENYAKTHGLTDAMDGMHFLTGTTANVKLVADSVGFKYKWIEDMKEWAHASAAVIATPDGQISRYLHGVYFDPQTFRLSVVEAGKGKVGSVLDQMALYCFRYDPQANQYAFYAMNVMKIVAFILLILMVVWLVPFWIRSRRQSSRV